MAATGRRQRLSADERREQLIAAAVDCLAERGFAGTTADEIARRAGVSKGLLWHYFADLDELFEVTARQILQQLGAAAGANIDLSAPAPTVIRAAVHAAADLRRTHPAQRRAIAEIVVNLRSSDGQLRLGQRDMDELYSAQEGIFRRGQQDGDFRDGLDPRLIAVTYQGAVDSMLSYLDAYPELDADSYADTVADFLLGGISSS